MRSGVVAPVSQGLAHVTGREAPVPADRWHDRGPLVAVPVGACLIGLARLSALVLLVSSSTASLGPVVFGVLRDATDSFTLPYALLAGVVAVRLMLVPRLRPGTELRPAGEGDAAVRPRRNTTESG